MDFGRIRWFSISAVALFATLAGCSRVPLGAPRDGTIAAGAYTNSYFGFSMAFPTGWSESSRAVAEQAKQDRAAALAAVARLPEARLDSMATEESHHLLVISEKPWGAATDSNPSIILAAEDVSNDRRIRDGKDYIVKVSRLLANCPLPYQPTGVIQEVELGGRTFGRLDFTANIAGKTLRQSHLARVMHGHALTFILSAASEPELKRLAAILDSVRFY
jgi:hypothetical protein